MLTADVDSDDTAAVVRNKGDGLDDEECPELEGRGWELRTRTSPGQSRPRPAPPHVTLQLQAGPSTRSSRCSSSYQATEPSNYK